MWPAFLLLWFLALHAFVFAPPRPPSIPLGLYVANLLALVLSAALTL